MAWFWQQQTRHSDSSDLWGNQVSNDLCGDFWGFVVIIKKKIDIKNNFYVRQVNRKSKLRVQRIELTCILFLYEICSTCLSSRKDLCLFSHKQSLWVFSFSFLQILQSVLPPPSSYSTTGSFCRSPNPASDMRIKLQSLWSFVGQRLVPSDIPKPALVYKASYFKYHCLSFQGKEFSI